MEKSNLSTNWKIEFLAILITIIIITLVIMPLLINTPQFSFLRYNIIAIAVFLTLIRYLFLLRLTPFARFAPLKVIFIFLAIPLLVLLIDGLAEFQFHLDDEGTYSMVNHLPIDKQLPMSKYIRAELIFFAVGAIISTFLLPIRMIISLWRVRNRNTV